MGKVASRKRYLTHAIGIKTLEKLNVQTEAVRSKNSERDRIEARYLEFCKYNKLGAWSAKSVRLFVAHTAAQLSVGSVKNALGHLREIERRRHLSPEKLALCDLYNVVQEEYAKTRKAPQSDDFAREDDVVRVLLSLGGMTRKVCLAMATLGLRAQDLTEVQNRDISILEQQKGRSVVIDLFFTKNRRDVSLSTRIHLEDEDLKFLPDPLWGMLIRMFPGNKPTSRPFSGMVWGNVADELRAVAEDIGVEAVTSSGSTGRITPGSFRRFFVHRQITKYTSARGTDWGSVAEHTGHRRAENVRAHYRRPLTHQ